MRRKFPSTATVHTEYIVYAYPTIDDFGLRPLRERPCHSLEPKRVHDIVVIEVGNNLSSIRREAARRADAARGYPDGLHAIVTELTTELLYH